MSAERYLPIADYGFLSDCHSTALVSTHGSIDWACMRTFDAASSFARLLDADRGGHFSIRPVAEITLVERHYHAATMVLETTMTTEHGSIRCTDAFAMKQGGSHKTESELIRLVECIDGDLEVEVIIEPRFDYGATRPWLRHHDDDRYTAVGGNDALIIHTTANLTIDRDRCQLDARVTISTGERLTFSVVARPAHLVETKAAEHHRVEAHLAETITWWEHWSQSTEADGPYADLLSRSAIVLKGLTCAPTGAIVAAPTTSLPEIVGGSANWDYRYSWVRDSTLALEALAHIGHSDVAQGFRDFIMRSSAGHGDELQIMYGPYGQRTLLEREIDLEGWRKSSPVRVGNAAATQTQLDVYGHLLDAAHLWHTEGDAIDDDEWAFLSTVVDEAAKRRYDPDSGVWEMRGPPRQFVESKVMIWVALDRGIRLVETYGYPDGSAQRWRKARDEVRHDIETRGVDPDRGNFVQYYGSQALDASLLKLALVGFVDANDERMRTTTDAIIDQLGTPPHGFLRRHLDNSAQPAGGTEGVFLLCSLWLVEVLALQGRIDEATSLFEAVANVGNDLGLFSEEYDTSNHELLGNFPQAFTHLGLIKAERRLRSAGEPH